MNYFNCALITILMHTLFLVFMTEGHFQRFAVDGSSRLQDAATVDFPSNDGCQPTLNDQNQLTFVVV